MGLIGTYDKETGLCTHYPEESKPFLDYAYFDGQTDLPRYPNPPTPPPPRITGGWSKPKPPPFHGEAIKAGEAVEFSERNYNNITKFAGLNAGFNGRLQGWNGNWSIVDEKRNVLHLGSQWNGGQSVWLFYRGKEVLFNTDFGVTV